MDTKEDKNHSDLWMERWDGAQNMQLTFGKEGASHPQFSPDGKYISFVSSRPGKAKGAQIWVMSRLGGEPQQFTEIATVAGAAQEIQDYAWSPDSKRLLLALQPKGEPEAEEGKPPAPPKPIVIDRYHFKQDIEGYLRNDQRDSLYLYDIAAKKLEKLTTDKNVDEEGPVWSPDGAWIAYVSNHDEDPDRTENTDVFAVAAKPGSAAKKLTNWEGSDGGKLAWSPDSKTIAYAEGTKPELAAYSQRRPAVVTLDGKVSYPAAKLDRSVSPSPARRRRYGLSSGVRSRQGCSGASGRYTSRRNLRARRYISPQAHRSQRRSARRAQSGRHRRLHLQKQRRYRGSWPADQASGL
jgi:Tol biopolymer transport system component